MKTPRARTWLAVVAIMALVAGCSTQVSGAPTIGTNAVATTSSATAGTTASSTAPASTPPSQLTTPRTAPSASTHSSASTSSATTPPGCVFGQCFTDRATMNDYYGQIVNALKSYMYLAFTVVPFPESYFSDSESNVITCQSFPGTDKTLKVDGNSYFYCAADKSVNIGLDLLWKAYSINPLSPGYVVAYQYAHHIIQAKGVAEPAVGTANAQLYELEAFCFVGLWSSLWSRSMRLPTKTLWGSTAPFP